MRQLTVNLNSMSLKLTMHFIPSLCNCDKTGVSYGSYSAYHL